MAPTYRDIEKFLHTYSYACKLITGLSTIRNFLHLHRCTMGHDRDTVRVEVDERTPLIPDATSGKSPVPSVSHHADELEDEHNESLVTDTDPPVSVIWLVFPILLAGQCCMRGWRVGFPDL